MQERTIPSPPFQYVGKICGSVYSFSLTCYVWFLQLAIDAASASASASQQPVTTTFVPSLKSTAPNVVASPVLNYVPLGSFSWDQDSNQVKVRVHTSLEVLWFSWSCSCVTVKICDLFPIRPLKMLFILNLTYLLR